VDRSLEGFSLACSVMEIVYQLHCSEVSQLIVPEFQVSDCLFVRIVPDFFPLPFPAIQE